MHFTSAFTEEINYTLDRNFSYGYNSGKYNLRHSSQDTFNCYYTKSSYVPESFRNECVRVCEQISDRAIKEKRIPYVLLSGGLDSEIVLRSFIESGREFKVISNKFYHELNSQEIYYISEIEKKFKINILYNDIDIVNWLTRSLEAEQLAYESKCIRPEMLPTMKLIDKVFFELNGIPVLGNGDFYASKDINPNWRMNNSSEKYQWNYIEYEYILAWMRYCIEKRIIGAVNFFQQTPEIVLAMALDPLISRLTTMNIVGKQSSRSTKYQVYQKYWPDLTIRPKYHGGEKILNICDYLRKTRLNKLYGCYNTKYKIPVDDFLKRLLPA